MSEQPKLIVSPAQYLEHERGADYKSEYYRGEMFAMAGGSLTHGQLANNVGALLFAALRGSGCRVFNSDVQVHIPVSGLYTYPDVSVVCGEPQLLDNQQDTLLNPTVLVEVLSPGTESYDRGQKFLFYRSIPSLREYVLVSQDLRHIEVFRRRNSDGVWELHEPDANGQIELVSIGCALSLEDVYADVVMPERTGLR